MDSLFLWELGTPKVYLIWVLVLAAQILVAEINRRWNWTIFALWTVGGIALMPYAWIHGTPMVGWFPFGKMCIRDRDITGQLSLAVLMGSLIKMICGAGHNKLDRI